MKKWQQTILFWDLGNTCRASISNKTNIQYEIPPERQAGHTRGPHYLRLSWLKVYTANRPLPFIFVQPLFWCEDDEMSSSARNAARAKLFEAVGPDAGEHAQPVLVDKNGTGNTWCDSMIVARKLRSGETFSDAAMMAAHQFIRLVGVNATPSDIDRIFEVSQQTWVQVKKSRQSVWQPFRDYLLDKFPLYPQSELKAHPFRF